MIPHAWHSQKKKKKTKNCSYWKQVSSYQELCVGNILTQRTAQGVLEVMELLGSLIVIIVPLIYTCVKINRTVKRNIWLYCRKLFNEILKIFCKAFYYLRNFKILYFKQNKFRLQGNLLSFISINSLIFPQHIINRQLVFV